MSTAALTALSAVIVALLSLSGTLYTALSGRRTSDVSDRAKLVDDLQEELKRLRADMSEASKEALQVRRRFRLLSEYSELCVATMRRAGIDPPPVPVGTRFPWEEEV